ncbi:MAG TPA: hypothetical protein VK783_08910 [Bacteroidia bacterium]|nr:hypothetical protein [Bacteroidia bacterium]
MKNRKITNMMLGLAGTVLAAASVQAQSTTPAPAPTPSLNQTNAISLITNGAGTAAPGGTLWGYVFGDYAYMQHGDSAGRGTKQQYKGLGAAGQTSNPNAFEVRRAYLGYNYNINSKFSAYALLAYEGDQDVSDNRTVYLKYIYFKWKNIFKGSDLKIGQQATNSFANAYNTEPLMGYRSVEKTIMDMHGVDGSSDMGLTLEGKIWHNKPADSTKMPTFLGYSAMVGDNSGNNPVAGFTGTATGLTNSTVTSTSTSTTSGGATTTTTTKTTVTINPFNATTDKDKKFRANLYVNTLNNALTVGVYTDYLNYGKNLYISANGLPINGTSSHTSEAVQTMKAYAVYNSKWVGIGVEWFTQTMTNGETEVWKKGTGTNDTVNATQNGISIFAHGTIIQNKLNIFARYDMYTPDGAYSYNANETFTSAMTNVSSSGNGNSYKETFINAGLDWTPTADKKIHFMPNIWSYTINNGYGSDAKKSDNYMLYRLTFLCAF